MLLDSPLGPQAQSEKDEAETVSAMASLSVDVDQPSSVPDNSDTSRSALKTMFFYSNLESVVPYVFKLITAQMLIFSLCLFTFDLSTMFQSTE